MEEIDQVQMEVYRDSKISGNEIDCSSIKEVKIHKPSHTAQAAQKSCIKNTKQSPNNISNPMPSNVALGEKNAKGDKPPTIPPTELDVALSHAPAMSTTPTEDAAKQGHTSKSYSLSKSCVNKKELVDIKGPISKEIFVNMKSSPITDDYEIGDVLGEGSFGQVKKCLHKRSGLERAVKIIRSDKIDEQERAQIDLEVAILKSIDHPNICKLYDIYQDAHNLYLVIEYCSGGELFDRIQKISTFSEKEAAKYIKQVLSALAYLHERDIVHRDLKAENLLFVDESPDANLKLIDFGVSCKHLKGSKKMKDTLGTPYYIAPEVILRNYDKKCDLWSCGVILYILLCGYPPFNGDDDDEILKNVKKGEFAFYGKYTSFLSIFV
jgi:tRNA A-37 threonylcarbamoyl transferase component Bud32